MASIRRTLSPLPPSNSLTNGGESAQGSSPLSRSSSNNQNNLPTHIGGSGGGGGGVVPSSLGSLDYTPYKAQSLILGSLSARSSRPLKAPSWRRSILHFSLCFMVGVFLGLTPFASLNLSSKLMPNSDKLQAFNFDVESHTVQRGSDEVSAQEGFSTSEPHRADFEPKEDRNSNNGSVFGDPLGQDSTASPFHKLVIVVTPTRARPLQAYYLTRLAHTLRLASNPLLWIVVEMNSQSVQTSELLRRTGVVYRHLACCHKNTTEAVDKNVMMRNLALLHIETHRLDGIVYFADDDGAYSFELFQQIRQISRFGTWAVAKVAENQGNVVLEGPICNGTKVIGWHVAAASAKRYRRFHADMSGFAFNSSIIWDQKRWHRPTLEAIRHVAAVREDLKASSFVEQIVEDESQMECLSMKIMAWQWQHHRTTAELSSSYHRDDSIVGYSLGSIFPLL